MHKPIEVDAHEVESRLHVFLRKVRAGARFTITQHGRPVAELVPCGSPQRIRATAAQRMQAFMREQSPVSAVHIEALIEEGRG